MINYILFDDFTRPNFLPFTYTRPVADMRIGILTIREKWEMYLQCKTSSLTQDYLQKKYPLSTGTNNTWIAGSVCPDEVLVAELNSLSANESLWFKDRLIAVNTGGDSHLDLENSETFNKVETKSEVFSIENPWDIFSKNDVAIKADYKYLTAGRTSQKISPTNQVIAPENVFLEEGATLECATLNATSGPIYIGKDAEVMEGAIIRGPFALGEHATVKMGAKIYGATTVGPHSKVGGEVSNSMLMGYSNKGHDGFLGNSVLGEWCNLGADTNNSNLKNNYANVKLWNYAKQRFVNTGLTFCGLMMGDHSKCGINTMFNTGTVVGVNANIFGAGFPRNFVPSFSWGGSSGFSEYKLKDAVSVAQRVYQRRGLEFNEIEEAILANVFEQTQHYRK